jgi:hypothetical protein
MEKISLKLSEFYQLEAELNGVVNQQTGEKLSNGLLNEKVKLTTKYWLSDLVKKVVAEKEAVEKVKNELIQKHGESDANGNVSIPFYANEQVDEEGNVISREVNPKFVKFQNEFNTLLDEERELEYKGFKLDELESIESSNNYPVFFKLIKVDK